MKELQLTLTPSWEGGHIASCDVSLLFNYSVAKGEIIFKRNLRTVGIPFLSLSRPVIPADDSGVVPVTLHAEEEPHIEREVCVAQRDTGRSLRVSYSVSLSEAGPKPRL